jgi:predicted O-methyltransferase YrrM
MKKIITILNKFKIPVDLIFFFILIPASVIFLMYRKIGSHKLAISKKLLKFIGIFPITDHYYEPQFNFDSLRNNFDKNRNLNGIKFNLKNQLINIKKLNFTDELINLNLKEKSTNHSFIINNKFFESGDAEIYYQIIRYFKPSKIIEVGSGYSTLLALEALKKNKEEKKSKKNVILCIEPYENKWLDHLNVKIIRKKIEDINSKKYLNLKKNDILFIDSSHMIKPQGDVLKIFLEILPKLKKGVIVHIHDIFTPKNYPKMWLIKENKFWNEQYLVEALISNTNRYEILLSLNYLKNKFYNKLKKVCLYLTKADEPSSLYLKINE